MAQRDRTRPSTRPVQTTRGRMCALGKVRELYSFRRKCSSGFDGNTRLLYGWRHAIPATRQRPRLRRFSFRQCSPRLSGQVWLCVLTGIHRGGPRSKLGSAARSYIYIAAGPLFIYNRFHMKPCFFILKYANFIYTTNVCGKKGINRGASCRVLTPF